MDAATTLLKKPNVEFTELLRASDMRQQDVAAWLTKKLGHPFSHYAVSRWSTGKVKIPVEVMDAMRQLPEELIEPDAAEVQAETLSMALVQKPDQDTTDFVPLYGYAGASLELAEAHRVGMVPIHPAQARSKSAFAIMISGDRLAPRLQHGDTAYIVRNKIPTKGEPCVVKIETGETNVGFFESMDDRTLFLSLNNPAKQLSFSLRDVVEIDAVVGVSIR